MTTTIGPRPDATPLRAPYRPSQASRFISWVDAQPGHGWWVFLLLYLAGVAWAHLTLWLTGRLPVGTIVPLVVTTSVYGPYSLAIMAAVNAVASGALRDFWPATGWPAEERESWRWRFVNAPAGFELPIIVIGTVTAAGSTLAPSDTVNLIIGTLGGDPVIAMMAAIPVAIFGYTTFVAMLHHTVHQLRLVARIHHAASAIDPFDRVPVYAFSRLTGLAGLAYVSVGYYSLTVNGAFQSNNPVALAALAAGLAVGIACFILPLWGIHGRLIVVKEQLLREADARATAAASELYRRVDAGQFDTTKNIADTFGGTMAVRDRIARLPTWPWPPQLLRGFVSALFLPVAIYLITRIVGTLISP